MNLAHKEQPTRQQKDAALHASFRPLGDRQVICITDDYGTYGIFNCEVLTPRRGSLLSREHEFGKRLWEQCGAGEIVLCIESYFGDLDGYIIEADRASFRYVWSWSPNLSPGDCFTEHSVHNKPCAPEAYT